MIEDCEAAGMPRPEFAAGMGNFIVRFRKAPAAIQPVDAAELSDRQRRAIAYVREHGRITTRQYEELLQVSNRQARRDLNALVNRGVLARSGGGPTTYYTLRRTQ